MNLQTKSIMRQRLLYLHAAGTHPGSLVTAAIFVEPVEGGADIQLQPNPQMPYNAVHDALVDGWRIVQFPRPNTTSDDRNVGVIGYEFILEKMEDFKGESQ